ncbi:MAG: calcium-binding protein [Microvirga sp.]
MATFFGTPAGDIVTPSLISPGVVTSPPGADLTGDDVIRTFGGNDIVEGDNGDDVAILGAGNDRFIWNPGDGDDVFNGGSGTDVLEFNGFNGVDTMIVTTLSASEFRFAREPANIVVDSRGVERVAINALDGDDVINALGQVNPHVRLVVNAGAGNDRVIGGAGNDRITGAQGDDIAFGRAGNDRFIWNPGDGDDTFHGGQGIDTLEFNGFIGIDTMTITTLANGGFQFFRDPGNITVDAFKVERIAVNALDGNDLIDAHLQTRSDVSLTVDGGTGDDTVFGGAGNDVIEGAQGNDVAFGRGGKDRFAWDPGDGNDTFAGGAGIDTLEFSGSADNEFMSITTLGNGGFRFFRDVGVITIDTTGTERVEVDALEGNDVVNGAAQTRAGVKLAISGGGGSDRLTGGAGGDTFIFGVENRNGVTERDVIRGYHQNQGDVIDLREAGGFVASNVVNGSLVLTLAGADHDTVLIRGVTSLGNVDFIL